MKKIPLLLFAAFVSASFCASSTISNRHPFQTGAVVVCYVDFMHQLKNVDEICSKGYSDFTWGLLAPTAMGLNSRDSALLLFAAVPFVGVATPVTSAALSHLHNVMVEQAEPYVDNAVRNTDLAPYAQTIVWLIPWAAYAIPPALYSAKLGADMTKQLVTKSDYVALMMLSQAARDSGLNSAETSLALATVGIVGQQMAMPGSKYLLEGAGFQAAETVFHEIKKRTQSDVAEFATAAAVGYFTMQMKQQHPVKYGVAFSAFLRAYSAVLKLPEAYAPPLLIGAFAYGMTQLTRWVSFKR